MTRIAYIIPYLSNKDQIDRTLAGMSIPENVHFELFEATEIDRDATRDWDCDIIIARGMTCDALRRHARNVQVIEIAVTGYDLVKAVQKTLAAIPAQRIAIVLTHNIFVDVEFFAKVFSIRFDFFKIASEQDAVEAVKVIKAAGCYDAVVGGGTVTRKAAAEGLRGFVVESGDESVRNAINEAMAAIYASRAEKRRNELISTMIESIGDGMVAIDQNRRILFMNEVCRRMLDIAGINVQGRRIEDFLGEDSLPELLPGHADGSGSNGSNGGSGGRPDGSGRLSGDSVIRKLGSRMTVIKSLPISVEGIAEGAILTLQSVDRLQKAEIDIRQKLSQKGLIAKYRFEQIVGASQALRKAVESAKRYARTDHDILIIGETGTGKELFAQSIHNFSSRREQPFVALNCATVSESLIESELFGYVEGAFTGAVKGGKIGLFELAHRGTLFLDEIAELPLALQAKLLRVLQEKEIRKLGDDKIIPIDVRIVAATNVSLRRLAAAGAFREDLLYRLDILSLCLPPLRQRREDIADLVARFTEAYNREGRERGTIVVEPDAIEALKAHDWKGNVRELRNICDRLYVLNSTGIITRQDVLEALHAELEEPGLSRGVRLRLDQADRASARLPAEEPARIGPAEDGIDRRLHDLLQDRSLSREEIARMLGISRTTLWRRLRDLQA